MVSGGTVILILPLMKVVVLNGRFDGVSSVSAVAPLSQQDAGLFQGRGKLAGIVASVLIPIDPGILTTRPLGC